MDRCAFRFCYYHDRGNARVDGVVASKFACDFCSEAYYHSEHCKKLDKEHVHKCRGNSDKENFQFRSNIKSNVLDLTESKNGDWVAHQKCGKQGKLHIQETLIPFQEAK